jgi:hypothetical protein
MPSASIVASRTWVVQNLHQEVRMQNNKENRIVLQRKLRFEEEEIWTELPESTREHCRGLWRLVVNDENAREHQLPLPRCPVEA